MGEQKPQKVDIHLKEEQIFGREVEAVEIEGRRITREQILKRRSRVRWITGIYAPVAGISYSINKFGERMKPRFLGVLIQAVTLLLVLLMAPLLVLEGWAGKTTIRVHGQKMTLSVDEIKRIHVHPARKF
ncbi:hypothetical protein [Shimazuella kribbensis]|uniref:hypothetical protein n=1 Tax=Shimazuella kribbensis TaxID=139808 RepID=UPI00048BFA81|nr:hypothetical protein [Shimazuella kribbensis]